VIEHELAGRLPGRKRLRRATPAVRYELPAQEDLAKALRRLFRRYARALDAASTFDASRSAGSAGLVQLIAQSHLRSKLKVVSATLAQLARAAEDPSNADLGAWLDTDAYSTWLDQKAAGTQKFADSLPAVQPSRMLKVVPSVFGGVAAVWVVINGLAQTSIVGSTATLEGLAAYLAAVAIVAIVVYRASFLAKRRLFLETAEIDRDAPPENVYQAEDSLFHALRRKKARETLLDLWLEGLPVAAVGFFLFVDPFRWTHGITFWSQILPAVVAAIVLILWSPHAGRSARRRWR
jgi:hypothetical protein